MPITGFSQHFGNMIGNFLHCFMQKLGKTQNQIFGSVNFYISLIFKIWD